MEKELRREEISTYGQMLFYQLDSLFRVGKISGDEENRVYDLSAVGKVLLVGIKDNLENLISMIEKKFGDLVVLIEKEDELIKPIKIELDEGT